MVYNGLSWFIRVYHFFIIVFNYWFIMVYKGLSLFIMVYQSLPLFMIDFKGL